MTVRQKTRRKPSNNPAKPLTVAELRLAIGLSRKAFSRLTGYSERAIAAWEAGKPPGDATRQRMTEIQRLQEGLARVMRSEFVADWLQTPNDSFGGLKPIEVVERGEIDRLWRMIHLVESGQPG